MEDIREGEHEVYFNARFMRDRHTHYEASAHIREIIPCTITIPGYIVDEFKEMYRDSIRDCIVHVKLDFIENQNHTDPDVYKGATHLRGTIHTLDEIISWDLHKNGIQPRARQNSGRN